MNTYQHEVKYYECDRMGITHHSNYVRFMEEARVDWLDQLGCGFDKIEAENVFSPVVSVSCEYKSPTTFKDIIDIEVKISKMSEMKFEFDYTMRSNDKLVCLGHSVHCFIENGRPVAISKRLPELYNSLTALLSK
ncbi:MAG: acyl-CoA thioesterase [Bacteroidales bacterium]|nr:acyl-CoA thioesterase [Bacteroidales bacterium]MCR5658644.1 acyl-CoA thioesterase [Bacteroidales bacterium]